MTPVTRIPFFLISVAFGSLLSSCTSTEKLHVGHPPLTDIKKINGDYEMGAWGHLHLKFPYDEPEPDSTKFVRLTALDDRRIEAKLMSKDEVVLSSTKLKGKPLDNGYFSLRRRIRLIPFIPVFFFYFDRKTDMILTSETIYTYQVISTGWE